MSEISTKSSSLQYYHKRKETDPEYAENIRAYNLNYYNTHRKNNEEYKQQHRKTSLELYYKKKEDPEYAELLRARWREATRARRLRLKELKANAS